jgi:hypothetical protein
VQLKKSGVVPRVAAPTSNLWSLHVEEKKKEEKSKSILMTVMNKNGNHRHGRSGRRWSVACHVPNVCQSVLCQDLPSYYSKHSSNHTTHNRKTQN